MDGQRLFVASVNEDRTKLRLLTVGRAQRAIDFCKKLGYHLAEEIERPWGFDVFLEKVLPVPKRP